MLSQKVKRLEASLLNEQVKIKPNNEMAVSNIDAIIESANKAMERFNKRMNDES